MAGEGRKSRLNWSADAMTELESCRQCCTEWGGTGVTVAPGNHACYPDSPNELNPPSARDAALPGGAASALPAKISLQPEP